MKRRMLCIILTAVMLLGLVPVTAMNVSADEETTAMTVSDDAIEVLKEFEGFHQYAYYDYGQWTIGYGTACGENEFPYGINKEHAEVLMRKEVTQKEGFVNDFIAAQGLDLEQHQFDALVLFTFNLGQEWLTADGDFRQSVIDGDTGNDFIYNMARWCKAGGEVLISLLERRLCEADMYLNGIYTHHENRREQFTYVLFDGNEGTLGVLMQGYDAKNPTVVRPVPYKTDYRFLGWYTEDLGGQWVTTLDESTSEMTLHAHWQKGEGSTDGAGNILGTKASYRYPAASIGSLSVFQTPDEGAKVIDTVAATATLSIVADYVDEIDVKWGRLSTGGWVKLGRAVADTVVSEEQPVKVTITNSFVNVRLEAGPRNDKVGTLNYGDVVTIYKTALVDGDLWGKYTGGWIALEYTDYELALENTEDENVEVIAKGVVTANSYLRVRKGPGTSYTEVGKLLPGDEVELTRIKKVGSLEWGRMEQGWICMTYVQIIENEPETPGEGETPDDNQTPGGNENPDDSQTPGDTENPDDSEESGAAVLTGTVINTDELRVRTGAGTGNKEVTRLKSGTKVTIYEQTMVKGVAWGRIDQGWVALTYIKLDITADNLENVVTGKVVSNVPLNVRTGAGTNFPKAASLPKGTKVTVYESTTVKGVLWGRIDQGWVALQYVQLDAALPNLPEKDDPADSEQPGGTDTPSEPEKLPEGALYSGTVINTDELRVREGAGTGYKEVTRLKRGTKVYIYDEETVKGVEWGQTDLGWVALTYIKVNPSAEDMANAVKGIVISNSNLNVRSGAGTNYAKLTSLATGTEVMVYETVKSGSTYWGRIDGGWVAMDYIQIVVDEPETPADPENPGEGENDGTDSEAPEDTTTPVEPEELPEGALYSGTVINTDELRVREGAGTGYKEVTRLKQGTKVYIYDEETVKGVEWGLTDLGWVALTYIKANPTAEDIANAVTGVVIAPNGMNVRSKPGAWNQAVGRLGTGVEVQIFEITEVNDVSWGRIDGGWVAMQHIQIIVVEPGLPNPDDGEDTGSDDNTGSGDNAGSDDNTGSTPDDSENEPTRKITVTAVDAEGKPVANVGITLKVNPQGGQKHYELLENPKLTDENGVVEFSEDALMELSADAIIYAIVDHEGYDFAWNADKTNKVRTSEAGTGTELMTSGGQDYLKVTAAAGKEFVGSFTLAVAEVEQVRRTITVTAKDARGNLLPGVPVSIKYVGSNGLVDVTEDAFTDSEGVVVFTNAELLEIAAGTRLVAEVGTGYSYAWTGAVGGNTVRLATAGVGVSVYTAGLQDYLDVTAQSGENFDGTFTISVVAAE